MFLLHFQKDETANAERGKGGRDYAMYVISFSLISSPLRPPRRRKGWEAKPPIRKNIRKPQYSFLLQIEQHRRFLNPDFQETVAVASSLHKPDRNSLGWRGKPPSRYEKWWRETATFVRQREREIMQSAANLHVKMNICLPPLSSPLCSSTSKGTSSLCSPSPSLLYAS